MSHDSLPVPEPDHNDHNHFYQTFSSWLYRQTFLFYSQLAGLGGFLSFIFALIYYISHGEYGEYINPQVIQTAVIWAHLPILGAFIVWLIKIFNKNDEGSQLVREVHKRVFNKILQPPQLEKCVGHLRKFKTYFLCFWVMMFFLYVSFLFQNLHTVNEIQDKAIIIQKLEEVQKVKDNREFKRKIKEIKESIDKSETIARISNEKEVLEDIKNINDNDLVIEDPVIRDDKLRLKVDDIVDKIAPPQFFTTEEQYKNLLNKIQEAGNKLGNNNETINTEELAKNVKEARDLAVILKNHSLDTSKLYSEFINYSLNTLGLLFIFLCFTILYLPANGLKTIERQRILLYFSTLTAVLLILSFPLILLIKIRGRITPSELTAYVTGFNALSGTLNAFTLALLIARLDSKFIGLPSKLICILYGYSAVQPLFVAFEQPGEIFQIIKTFVLIFVFIFKIYFFFIIIYALQTGRMLNYLVCFPTLEKRVDSIFSNEFLVEGYKTQKGYKCKVKRKKRLVYLSDTDFDTEADCRKEIERLQELTKQHSSYKINAIGKKWRVEVFDNHERLVCYSEDFRSERRAQYLVEESMEKIPHCEVIVPLELKTI